MTNENKCYEKLWGSKFVCKPDVYMWYTALGFYGNLDLKSKKKKGCELRLLNYGISGAVSQDLGEVSTTNPCTRNFGGLNSYVNRMYICGIRHLDFMEISI
jgi:hypothetical protein